MEHILKRGDLAAAAAAHMVGRAPTEDVACTAPLTPADMCDWTRDGYIVHRNVFAEHELAAVERQIDSHYRAHDFDMQTTVDQDRLDKTTDPTSMFGAEFGAGSFPLAGSRLLQRAPELAALTCGHPGLLRLVEQLLGGTTATVSQFQHTLRTPGSVGSGLHYDYKPWRPVGSFLHWCFVVIPLNDYTAQGLGKILVCPGSHRETTVLPSDGRVHRVAAARVRNVRVEELFDPELRRGDVLVFGDTATAVFRSSLFDQ